MEPGLVDDRADARERDVAVCGHRLAQQLHGARVGVREAEEHPNQRGLARAVGAEVPDGATARHQEVDAVHRGSTAENFGQAVGLDGQRSIGVGLGRDLVQDGGHGVILVSVGAALRSGQAQPP